MGAAEVGRALPGWDAEGWGWEAGSPLGIPLGRPWLRPRLVVAAARRAAELPSAPIDTLHATNTAHPPALSHVRVSSLNLPVSKLLSERRARQIARTCLTVAWHGSGSSSQLECKMPILTADNCAGHVNM